jgi:uncharacterized protein (TIGR03792 family)
MALLAQRLLAVVLAFGLLLSSGPALAAAAADDPQTSGNRPSSYSVVVVEHLRVKVAADAVNDWLEAEQGSWEPWLAAQPGFLDRQLLWDPEREEGTLLIHWASRDQWKAIPQAEVEQVQQRFEHLARLATGRGQGNPFPLVFEGELLPQ